MTRPIARILPAILLPAALFLAAPHLARGADHHVPASIVAPGAKWITLAGSVSPAVRLARVAAPLPASKQIGITVTLRLRDASGLDAYIAAVSNPISPFYRRVLSSSEFARRFGPTVTAHRAVASWLRGQGLRVVGQNGMSIRAAGPVTRVEAAFDTPLTTYRRRGFQFYANSRPIRLPGTIASSVTAITGLSDAGRARPLGLAHAGPKFTPGGYSPAELAQAYDMASLRSSGIKGQGQTIGVASFGQYDPANISTYDQQFGISTSLERVQVDDGISLGPDPGGQDESEAELDIEVLQAGAPGAHIVVYEAPNDDAGFINNFTRIVEDNRVALVTTSWGEYEAYFPPDELNAVHQALQQAAAQGQTVFAASGDNGAYDAYSSGDSTLAGKVAVDYPCSDPYVTCVGGTSLQTTTSGAYAGETAWSSGTATSSPIGGGGGLSIDFTRPPYQVGPGVQNSYSNGMRQVPDVSAEAENGTGYALYIYDYENSNPDWGQYGGTSASAPFWTGFAATVQQAIGHRLGFLNPALYLLGSDASTFTRPPFHDVTQGTNLFYPAAPGWDFATGWGSMDGQAFVQDFQSLGTLKATPVPTPTGWKNGRPLPTATPSPTPRPIPALSITSIVLTHKIHNRQVKTNSLRLGEKGTLTIVIKVFRGRAADAFGSVLFRHKGKLVATAILRPGTFGGHTAFVAGIRISNRRTAGPVTARATISLQDTSVTRSHTFTVLSSR